MAAAAHGTVAQITELLTALAGDKSGVNAQDTGGMTALMLAAKSLNVEACATLLRVPSLQVNVQDAAGKSALHHVCAARPSSANDLAPYTDVLETLFELGADAGLTDLKGWLPLHEACNAGNYTAVSALLQNSPDAVSTGTVREPEIAHTQTEKNPIFSFFFFFFSFFPLSHLLFDLFSISVGVRCISPPSRIAPNSCRCCCASAPT